MLLGLEDSGGRMGRLGRGLMASNHITTIDEHVARLRAVTADDVQRVLRRVLGGPRALAAVGPFEADDLLTRSEAHTSELQSLLRISYARFFLQTKKISIKIQ